MATKRQLVEKEMPEIKFRLDLSLNELVNTLKNLDEEEREFCLENLLAALSSEYLKSIEEARQDYKNGRTLAHEEVFL